LVEEIYKIERQAYNLYQGLTAYLSKIIVNHPSNKNYRESKMEARGRKQKATLL
jgi:hypothetical protein